MSISNELSTEVAAAILTIRTNSAEKLDDLKKTVLLVHSILQKLERTQANGPTDRSSSLHARAAFPRK